LVGRRRGRRHSVFMQGGFMNTACSAEVWTPEIAAARAEGA
jgi:hypothetical protein